ncbi:DUF935 domain-containing protein [Algimonas porphyrae]|uniref:DUF935 domain-containing protein n=1 Tax=Algimonas porphyrae TaxID=1128113 RepID=A0ABQ5UYW7_9PROT|nr:DUF935 domain-containing protein [Algimonas porphyrae]GLQ20494.1 hypothetical protein GCM10007854_14490 [Algimonas porphyrae]
MPGRHIQRVGQSAPIPNSKKPKPGPSHAVAIASASQSLWASALGSLTPFTLSRILRRHGEGDLDQFLIFAEEAEEKNEHYGSVLGTRKRAVEGLNYSVEPGGDTPADKEMAKLIGSMLDNPVMVELVEDMLDALGKGYSVNEIIWHTESGVWVPVAFNHVDPRAFQLDQLDRRQLRLKSRNDRAGIPLQPYKFVTHFSKLKSGAPHRAALARFVAWTYIFQNFTIKDWVGFVETYGQPLRVGKYGAKATDEDIATLVSALRNIGTDAAAAIPQSMQIEFIKATGTTSGGAFKELAEYCDRRISKAVLGQTMTTDDGSSQAQAIVHDDVRTDIKRADARRICTTLNRYLVRPVIDLNFGPQAHYPKIVSPVLDAQDLNELRAAIKDFTAMGIQVPQSFVHSRWGIPQAKDTDTVLAVPEAGSPAVATARQNIAMARRSGVDPDAALEDLIEKTHSDWEPIADALADPIIAAIRDASDYEDALARLDAIVPDSDPLAARLRDGLVSARLLGNTPE